MRALNIFWICTILASNFLQCPPLHHRRWISPPALSETAPSSATSFLAAPKEYTMGIRLTDSITWVGKIDWGLEKFHGEEYSTFKGSSYNAYLVRDTKKALIDSVYRPFAREFVENLTKEIDLTKIDYIIANHGEVDHSGALSELIRHIPEVPVYCTAQCAKTLKGYYHQDWNFITVKTGDTLNLGTRTLTFISAPMLHWPDSMFTYMDTENVLFSNDGFGQHLASDLMFNDLVDPCELMHECLKYYANILTPFNKMVTKKIREILVLGLPVNWIMPGHGIIWRDNPLQIVNKYLEWADDYQENQVTILYDTMWNSTRDMAEAIARGIRSENQDVLIKILHVAQRDNNEVLAEVFRSKMIIAGSSTINKGILHGMSGILEMIHGLAFKNKLGAAFGSYGWSGEGVQIISRWLEKSGFAMEGDGLKLTWKPDSAGTEECEKFGRMQAQRLKIMPAMK